jgi:hypothetical protein
VTVAHYLIALGSFVIRLALFIFGLAHTLPYLLVTYTNDGGLQLILADTLDSLWYCIQPLAGQDIHSFELADRIETNTHVFSRRLFGCIRFCAILSTPSCVFDILMQTSSGRCSTEGLIPCTYCKINVHKIIILHIYLLLPQSNIRSAEYTIDLASLKSLQPPGGICLRRFSLPEADCHFGEWRREQV